MPRHKRTWKERHDTPDRRTFVLQLYGNAAAMDRFEEEARLLDVLASEIDGLITGPMDAARQCTSIRHNAYNFNCYVGTYKDDKVLIVMRRRSNALGWSKLKVDTWCRDVANKWFEASGYPTLAGKQPPRPGATTSAQVADPNLSTPTPDG